MSKCKDFHEIYEPLSAIGSEILVISRDISDMAMPSSVAVKILEGIADHVQRLETDLREMERKYNTDREPNTTTNEKGVKENECL